MDMICQFNKLKPPKFQGGSNPLKYEEWMRRMENLFEIMECPAHYKVALVTYQFEGEVVYWWGTVKPREGENPITWDRLKEMMDNQYHPRDVRRMKEMEFLNLKQGSLSIMEYVKKFNELSRFAPHQVDTEERRMDHFEHGLGGDIRSMIAGQTFENFHEMYQQAVKIARVSEESKMKKQALDTGKRNMGPPKKGFPDKKRFKPVNYQGKGKQPAEGRPIPRCETCGKYHGGECTFVARCFECGVVTPRIVDVMTSARITDDDP